MTPDESLPAALRGVLDAVENAPPVEAVEAATRGLQAALGALSASFLIADLSGRALVRLSTADAPGGARTAADAVRRDAREVAQSQPFDGGAAGRALQTQRVQVLPPGDTALGVASPGGWTVLAPVTERGESLGLLELVLPVEPTPAVVEEIARTAHLLGFVVVAGRRHTDFYEWAQRTTPYSLSAEIQRRLLPPGYTCEADAFTLSAWLEPSATVGGDTYDYSLARDVLHLSMTDAMGHGVASALTATLCVGGLRNARRHGRSLLEQAAAANAALCDHHAEVSAEAFSTGLLGRLDLTTGVMELVNAGHVPPFLLRDGEVVEVALPPGVPLGLFPDARYVATALTLHAGDRLVLVTDGLLERNAEHLDLPALIGATADLHPREATRALTDRLLEATGQALEDDATLLVLDWRGHHGQGRDTRAGANAS
ncbi:PP2C family protein-serine/threonine phosphatase [Cellulomonas sp. ATA003]|uniref:PP2C family protein-serine/threonine phosphatase n=1 Tax=Cellulomonas sp. ATA003 TaxID=3073064 RepID=UPI0028736D60|nr:PP2C family protein-serine/threonine phosphatase [Cellulomonas sp. ATA003]WNB86197.1 PP2C family protein-serine/threonine phosphatase [Cellulomonas sp. ATA003]